MFRMLTVTALSIGVAMSAMAATAAGLTTHSTSTRPTTGALSNATGLNLDKQPSKPAHTVNPSLNRMNCAGASAGAGTNAGRTAGRTSSMSVPAGTSCR